MGRALSIRRGGSGRLGDRRADAPWEDVDAAIGDMPRTEVIDGVTVGFKQLASLDTDKQLTEKAYLVLWRKDDHLVGFVYRSRKEIVLGAVVREAPALVRAVRGATP